MLTDRQNDILIGSLLGDGSLIKIYKNNSAFREGHSENQYDYLKWKFDELQPYSQSLKPEARKSIIGFNKEKKSPIMSDLCNYTCWVMRTSNNIIFTDLERIWYQRNEVGEYVLGKNNRRIKIVPIELKLSPLSIAVWFMDDGTNLYNGASKLRNAVFHTLSFSLEECHRLCDCLKDVGIKHCDVRKHSSSGCYEICVFANSFEYFIEMVSQYIPCESIKYKADFSSYVKPKTRQECSAKLTSDKLSEIIKLIHQGKTGLEISKIVQVSPATISMVARGKQWQEITGIVDKGLPMHNKSGNVGVYFHKGAKKWVARIGKVYLGVFTDKIDAIKAVEDNKNNDD